MFSEPIAEAMSRTFGIGYLILAYLWLGLVPLIFLSLLRKSGGSRGGLVLGIAVGVWASLSWLAVPYCGVYPNLPGALIGGILFGVGSVGQEVCVHVLNLTLWPWIAWLYFGARRGSTAVSTPTRDAA